MATGQFTLLSHVTSVLAKDGHTMPEPEVAPIARRRTDAPMPAPDASGNAEAADRELIALCRSYVALSTSKEQQWQAADDLERRVLALHSHRWGPRQEIDPLYAMARKINQLPARTADGVRAKALVVRRWLAAVHGLSDSDPDPCFSNDPELATAWSLTVDVLR